MVFISVYRVLNYSPLICSPAVFESSSVGTEGTESLEPQGGARLPTPPAALSYRPLPFMFAAIVLRQRCSLLKSIGLVRCSAKPARLLCAMSSSMPKPLTATP